MIWCEDAGRKWRFYSLARRSRDGGLEPATDFRSPAFEASRQGRLGARDRQAYISTSSGSPRASSRGSGTSTAMKARWSPGTV